MSGKDVCRTRLGVVGHDKPDENNTIPSGTMGKCGEASDTKGKAGHDTKRAPRGPDQRGATVKESS